MSHSVQNNPFPIEEWAILSGMAHSTAGNGRSWTDWPIQRRGMGFSASKRPASGAAVLRLDEWPRFLCTSSMTPTTFIRAAFIFVLAAFTARADVRLHNLFTDHAVLQQ